MEVAPGRGLVRPMGQGVQEAGEAAPVLAPNVPAAQRKGRPPTQ